MRADYVSKILGTVWDLPKLRARTMIANMAKILRDSSAAPSTERPGESAFGEPLPKMKVVGNVAVIPMRGIISMNVPDWIKSYGFNVTDANDIEEEINSALVNSNVDLIVFDVDSPGGWDLASVKLFEIIEVAARKKPCYAFCPDGGDMASGAYYAVAACKLIYAGWYADGVGCIGCYLAWLDDTKFWEEMGFKIEVFRSGELKGLGEDSLDETQRNYLQKMVDDSGDRFRKNVSKYRKQIARADMEGQWFEGSEAAKHGFVHACVDNLETAIKRFQADARAA